MATPSSGSPSSIRGFRCAGKAPRNASKPAGRPCSKTPSSSAARQLSQPGVISEGPGAASVTIDAAERRFGVGRVQRHGHPPFGTQQLSLGLRAQQVQPRITRLEGQQLRSRSRSAVVAHDQQRIGRVGDQRVTFGIEGKRAAHPPAEHLAGRRLVAGQREDLRLGGPGFVGVPADERAYDLTRLHLLEKQVSQRPPNGQG